MSSNFEVIGPKLHSQNNLVNPFHNVCSHVCNSMYAVVWIFSFSSKLVCSIALRCINSLIGLLSPLKELNVLTLLNLIRLMNLINLLNLCKWLYFNTVSQISRFRIVFFAIFYILCFSWNNLNLLNLISPLNL